MGRKLTLECKDLTFFVIEQQGIEREEKQREVSVESVEEVQIRSR